MTRKKVIESAKKRLKGSTLLLGLLAKYGKVRVFPEVCEDYVTFTMENVPMLLAEYQGVKDVAPAPWPVIPPATP